MRKQLDNELVGSNLYKQVRRMTNDNLNSIKELEWE